MGQKIGGPASGQMTYGDMGLSPDDGRLGNVGFVRTFWSSTENIVPGRGQNSQICLIITQPQL